MCGFAGVIAWEDKYRTSRQTLARMSAAVAHRGPDGEGTWFNHEAEVTPARPQAALAFRRLAIIDLDPRANQPMTDGHGRWIVFNGEIYNYRELRKELSSLDPHYEWKTQGDTEVLLRSYAQWGEHCVNHLNGMFAFAVWDENRKELYLARDRMGQKPLYVAHLPSDTPLSDGVHVLSEQEHGVNLRAMAFASEMGALMPLNWINREIEPQALLRYLQWGYVLDSSSSIYRGVSQVYPGKYHRVTRQAAPFHSYFPAREPLNPEAPESRNPVARTRELVQLVVSRQMVADVPVGCFLSGGIDSSVIAAAMKAAAAGDQRVMTFSIGFDDPRYDESKYATAVAKHLGTEHHAFHVTPKAAEDLPKLAAAFGEPFGDSSALPTHYLSRETRKHVKVALSGDGGDELFGGYDRYRAMLLGHRLRTLTTPLPWMVIGHLAKRFRGGHPKSTSHRLVRFIASLRLRPSRRYASYLRLMNDELLRALFMKPYFLMHNFDDVEACFSWARHHWDMVRSAAAVDRWTYLPDDLLTKVDRASMLHALEVRSPFMDHELVQFAEGLTTDQLIKGGPKRMLREAFANDLPDFVFKRKKMGFAVPIGEWMRNELRPMLHDHLFAADSFASAHFNRKVVERLVAEHQEQRVDHSQRLYALLMLELWWRL